MCYNIVIAPRQVRDPSDDAYPEGPRPWYLHQTAGGGAREEGQLCARGLYM